MSKQIAAHVAAKLDVSAGSVVVEPVAGADVPGVTVFTARVPASAKGRPPRHVFGVAAGGDVISEQGPAMARVMTAWDYGPKRTVPPAAVARVLGVLQGSSKDPTGALLSEADLKSVAEELQAGLFVPREIEVDGKPAVEYWVTSSEVPLRRTVAVVNSDRTVSITVEQKWQ